MAAHWCNSPSSWPVKGKPLSRRRNSDTHLLANPINRIKKLELSRQHSLPDNRSKQLDKIFESAALDAAHTDDVWLQEAGIRSNPVSKRDTSSPNSMEDIIQIRQSEKKGLYSRRSSKHFGIFDKTSTTLYSSDPDIYTGQAHLGYHGLPTGQLNLQDLRADEEPSNELDQNTQITSRITNIFSTAVPSSYSPAKRPKKGLRQTRKHSLDSQLKSTKQQHKSTSADSKRAIKISRPDHMTALYISGVDTLGGLPDDEDGQHLHRKHLLSRLSELYLEFDPQGTLSRRSSCPVIFEGEESDESVEAETQPYLSSSLDRDIRLLSVRHRGGGLTPDHTDSSSGEASNSQHPQISDMTGESRHFYIGSDPFDVSDEVDPDDISKDSKDATNIVERTSMSEKARKSKIPRLENKSLREPGHARTVLKLTVNPDQQAPRKHDKATSSDVKSETQPQGTRSGVKATSSETQFQGGRSGPKTTSSETQPQGTKSGAKATSFETQPQGTRSGAKATSFETQLQGTRSGAKATSSETQPQGTKSGAKATSFETQPQGTRSGAKATSSEIQPQGTRSGPKATSSDSKSESLSMRSGKKATLSDVKSHIVSMRSGAKNTSSDGKSKTLGTISGEKATPSDVKSETLSPRSGEKATPSDVKSETLSTRSAEKATSSNVKSQILGTRSGAKATSSETQPQDTRSRVKAATSNAKSEAPPQDTGSGARVEPSACSIDDRRITQPSACSIDDRRITQPSSEEESGTSTSQSHPSSVTSSADESSS